MGDELLRAEKEYDLKSLSPENFGQILEILLQNGFEAPLFVAVIASNGAFMIGRYDEDGENLRWTKLADSNSSELRPPINIMYVDTRGEAARIVIKPTGESEIQLQ
ncbi:MAG TPA: hypothetical protein VK568_08820 [Thermodesulfobacteriota bacterium]|jgi:hypothetical protein|nr:hypothetical protein [Thermodesulfobacteriota bacterium]